MIWYERTSTLSADDFAAVLISSGLGTRRPVDDHARIARMLAGAQLVLTASDAASGALVGVARAVTDFAYCCYLSDLAVDRAWQGQGIGTRLIAETRHHAGAEAMCLLIAAPDAERYYERIGMPREPRAFLYPRLR